MKTNLKLYPKNKTIKHIHLTRKSKLKKKAVVTFDFTKPLPLSREVPYLHLNLGHLALTGDPTYTFVTLQRIFRELNIPEKSVLSVVPAFLVSERTPIPLNLRGLTSAATNAFFLLGPPHLKDKPLTFLETPSFSRNLRFGLDNLLSVLYTYYNPHTFSVHGKYLDEELRDLSPDVRRALFEKLFTSNLIREKVPYIWNVYPKPQQYVPLQGLPFNTLLEAIKGLSDLRKYNLVSILETPPPEHLYLRLQPWWNKPIWFILRRLLPNLVIV